MTPSDQPIHDAAKIAADAAAAARVKAAIDAMLHLKVEQLASGFRESGWSAVDELARVLGVEMSNAAMEGASAVLKAFDAALKSAGQPAPLINLGLEAGVAKVPPTRAIEALLKREPRLATTAAQVADAYRGDKVFAIAKSIDIEVTQRVHGAMIEALRTGTPTDVLSRVVSDLGEWTQGYAETVTQNNLMRAYSDGQMIAAKSPGIRDVCVGFEYAGPDDSSTRPNHRAAIGYRAPVDSSFWGRMGPPSGHRCRHVRVIIDRFRAERNGWLDANGDLLPMAVPSGAHPDEGFRPR